MVLPSKTDVEESDEMIPGLGKPDVLHFNLRMLLGSFGTTNDLYDADVMWVIGLVRTPSV